MVGLVQVRLLITLWCNRYYEVEILSPGSCAVGWALTDAGPDVTLGGDDASWAYDGSRLISAFFLLMSKLLIAARKRSLEDFAKPTAKSGPWATSSESSLTPTTRPLVSREHFFKSISPLFQFWRGNYWECGKCRGRWENHIRTATSRRSNCGFANSCIVRPRFLGCKKMCMLPPRAVFKSFHLSEEISCSMFRLATLNMFHYLTQLDFFWGISGEKGRYLIHQIAREI